MEKRTHKKTKATVLQMQKPSQEEHDLFTFKSEYLMNNPYFDFHEINCEDYFDKVFCRPGIVIYLSRQNSARNTRNGKGNMKKV